MWWGIGLAVVSQYPNAPYLLSGALFNTLLFLFVSIPLADGRQSKKEGFEVYKKETRMLLPIPK
jgi:steroid 5-alpha reductase family enzyme